MSVNFTKIGSFLDSTIYTLSNHFERMMPETKIRIAKGVSLTSLGLRTALAINFLYQMWPKHPHPHPANLELPTGTALVFVGAIFIGWILNDKMEDVIKKAQQQIKEPGSK